MPIGRRRRGAPLPGRGRPGQPGPAARLPLRHRAADRRGLRAAGRAAGRGAGPSARTSTATCRGSASSTTGPTRPAGTPPSRTPWPTRSTRPAGRRRTGLRRLAALRARRALRRAGHPRRARRHRPRRRRQHARPGERRRRRRGLGRRADGRPRHPGPPGAVPDQQPRRVGGQSDDGVTPLDSATQIAIPEFDGRIITAPFSFKEIDEDGLPRYVADPERCARVARIAVNHARLRRTPPARAQGRADAVGVPDQALAGRQRRRPGHPGLHDPAAAPDARRRLRPRRARRRSRASTCADDTEAGDALIHALIAAGGQDEEWLTHAQLTDAHVRITPDAVRRVDRRPARRPARADHRGVGRGARHAVRQRRRRDRARHDHGRQRGAADPAAARLRGEPGRDLPRPRPGAHPPLPGGLPLARGLRGVRRLRRARRRAPRQARLDGVAARARTPRSRPPAPPTPRSATCR